MEITLDRIFKEYQIQWGQLQTQTTFNNEYFKQGAETSHPTRLK